MYSVKDFENFSIRKKIREYERNYVEKKINIDAGKSVLRSKMMEF